MENETVNQINFKEILDFTKMDEFQRDQNKAFIAYEKISKTIDSVIHEQQIEDCYWMTFQFYNNHKNFELHQKLIREIEIKLKSLNSTFH